MPPGSNEKIGAGVASRPPQTLTWRNNGASRAPAQLCGHTRRRLIYRRHSLFAEMECRVCGVFLGRLLRPDPQQFRREKKP
jgi:hypothetical protein